MLDKSAQAGQHTYKERGDDCYQTPACAVEALLHVESLPRHVWERACGPGSIVRVLAAHGHRVFASDVIDYGWGHIVDDFFTSDIIFRPAIVTNPPYKFAA